MAGFRQMATALALPFVITSCGAVPSPVSQSSHASAPFACPSPTPVNDFGMSDEQRMAIHRSLTAHWDQCYTDWESRIDYGTLKWSTLPIVYGHADFAPPADSLSRAKAGATLIVSGTALSLSRGPRSGLDATFRVDHVFKGHAHKTIVIPQAAHLWPQDNWQTIVISVERSTPILLPGDAVFLFLDADPRGLYTQPFTGTYFLRDGLIQAVRNNPFGSKVNGLTPAEFADAINAA